MSKSYRIGRGASNVKPPDDSGQGLSDELSEIGDADELIEQLDEKRLTTELAGLSESGNAGRFPIWLVIKIIKFIICILILIFKLLKNRKFGLKEIKREIREIEKHLKNGNAVVPGIVTTGPVGRNVGVGSIVVKILNNTAIARTVTATVYDITQCPKTAVSQGTVTIQPCCEETFIFDAPVQYEVEVSGLVRGVYVWSAARLQPPAPPLAASVYVAANTFRHHEFVAQVPCPTPANG